MWNEDFAILPYYHPYGVIPSEHFISFYTYLINQKFPVIFI
jgi:hypothetical protein